MQKQFSRQEVQQKQKNTFAFLWCFLIGDLFFALDCFISWD